MIDINLKINCSELLRNLIFKIISVVQKTCNITKMNILYQNSTICDQLMIMTNYELETLKYIQILMHFYIMCHEFI